MIRAFNSLQGSNSKQYMLALPSLMFYTEKKVINSYSTLYVHNIRHIYVHSKVY